VAELNAPALRTDIERYLRLRAAAAERYEMEERAARQRLGVDIPAISPSARRVLERVRDAIDRNDLPAALEFALADKMIEAQLKGLGKAVGERFGERALLPNGALEPHGPAFEKAANGLSPAEREKLVAAWPLLRATQQLAAHQRTTEALKKTEALRQSQRQSQALK
jgi:hypothetical protein